MFDFSTLGIFGRANGLSMLIAGRIGSVTMMTLTPVVTRAEPGSARFQRLADLVLRGVVWTTLPAAALLGLTAHDTVALLYGAQWDSVAALLPLAALAVGLGGIISALSSLLVANDGSRGAMVIDVAANVSAILLAVALVPYGVWTYVAGLGVHAVVVVAGVSALLLKRGAISPGGIATSFVPALAAGVAAMAVVLALRELTGPSSNLVVRLAADAIGFGIAYIAALRFAFPEPLSHLLEVVPGGALMRQWLNLTDKWA